MAERLFLSCDWGTTRFRLRLAELATGKILWQTSSAAGAATIAAETPQAGRPEAYCARLRSALAEVPATLVDNPLALPVVISGMASSSVGWCELPYARLSFPLDGSGANCKELQPLDERGDGRVLLVSGVCSDADVMRGEETEAIGAWQLPLARELGGSAIIVLPGTHSKHLRVRDGAIVDFQTYMTGELFEVLSRHSVLRHSLPDFAAAADISANEHGDEQHGNHESFLAGAVCVAERPLASALFQVRTGALLRGRSRADSAEFLSGLLIGSELQTLQTPRQHDEPILLCAAGKLAGRYASAADALGLSPRLRILPAEDVSRLAVLGQAAIWRASGSAAARQMQ